METESCPWVELGRLTLNQKHLAFQTLCCSHQDLKHLHSLNHRRDQGWPREDRRLSHSGSVIQEALAFHQTGQELITRHCSADINTRLYMSVNFQNNRNVSTLRLLDNLLHFFKTTEIELTTLLKFDLNISYFRIEQKRDWTL